MGSEHKAAILTAWEPILATSSFRSIAVCVGWEEVCRDDSSACELRIPYDVSLMPRPSPRNNTLVYIASSYGIGILPSIPD